LLALQSNTTGSDDKNIMKYQGATQQEKLGIRSVVNDIGPWLNSQL